MELKGGHVILFMVVLLKEVLVSFDVAFIYVENRMSFKTWVCC